MENKHPNAVIRILNLIILALFSVICILFIPSFTDYLLRNDLIAASSRIPVMIGGTALALPCAVILIMALRLSASDEDRIFTQDTADLLNRIAWILGCDCLAFAIVTVILFAVGEGMIALIDLIGFSLAYLLRTLSAYIRRAADMKEEVDATL